MINLHKLYINKNNLFIVYFYLQWNLSLFFKISKYTDVIFNLILKMHLFYGK